MVYGALREKQGRPDRDGVAVRDPKATLHRPVEALRRLQNMAGSLRGIAGDRNENRAAQIEALSREMFETAVAALGGGPLPEPKDQWRNAR